MSYEEQLARWNEYMWPDTIDRLGGGVLRNKQGIKDPWDLAVVERRLSDLRELELRIGGVDIPRTYDAEHLRALHRHLFQDTYEWAGEFRTVEMGKGDNGPAFAWTGQIQEYLDWTAGIVEVTPWLVISEGEFVEQMARTYATYNVAHPFREGNGRVGKLFLHQVAAQSTFQLDFSKVDREDWNWFSEKSLPASGERKPRWREMIPVFEAMVDDRPQNPEVAEAFQEMMRLFPDAAALEDLAADVDEHAYNVPAIDDYGIER